MPYEPLTTPVTRIEYSHENFGEEKSAVEFKNDGIYPDVVAFGPGDTEGIGTTQFQPDDGGGWTVRTNTNAAQKGILVNATHQVEMGDGAPVVTEL